MKISWNEWQHREDCLMRRVGGEQQVLFEAKQLVDPEYREAIYWQRATYAVIRQYGRAQLRCELKHIHRQLFTMPAHASFAEKVKAFFRK